MSKLILLPIICERILKYNLCNRVDRIIYLFTDTDKAQEFFSNLESTDKDYHLNKIFGFRTEVELTKYQSIIAQNEFGHQNEGFWSEDYQCYICKDIYYIGR